MPCLFFILVFFLFCFVWFLFCFLTYIYLPHLPCFASINTIYLQVKHLAFQIFQLAKHTSTSKQIKIISILSFTLILISLYIQVFHPNFHRSVHGNTYLVRRHDFPMCWCKFIEPAPSGVKDCLKTHHFLLHDSRIFSVLLYVRKRYSKYSCKQLLALSHWGEKKPRISHLTDMNHKMNKTFWERIIVTIWIQ